MIANQQENIVTDEQTGADAPPVEQTDQPAVIPESEVPEAVRQALREPVKVAQVQLAPCPCGVTNVNLLIDLPQGSKVGRAGCSACGVWGTDFLAPRTQDQELIAQAAAKSWNEAPRSGHQ